MKIKRMLLALAVISLVAASAQASGFGMTLTSEPVGRIMESRNGIPEIDNARVDDQCDPDAVKICCEFNDPACADFAGEYGDGDIITHNTYWENVVTADDCADWTVLWTLGLKPPTGSVIFLFRDEPVSFGDVCEFVDLNVTFCVGAQLAVGAPIGPGNYNWGFGVSTPVRPFALGAVDGFTVAAAGNCTP